MNKNNRYYQLIYLLFPYTAIVLGVLLIFLIPLSFYSNRDLNLTSGLKISQNTQSIDKQTGTTELPLRKNQVEGIFNQEIVYGGDVAVDFPKSNPITPLNKLQKDYTGHITASSVLVLDERSKKKLYTKNVEEVRPLASITKLMSALTLLDFPIDWSSTTSIKFEDGNGDQLVKMNEVYTLEDLWQTGLVGSSNRAINALIRAAGLNKEEFVARMNDKAQKLKLNSLSFVEPTGLSDKNVGKASDIASLLHEALKFDKIYTTLRTAEHYAQPLNQSKLRRIWSTDWLLTNWINNDFGSENIVGKTGYITESNYNFAVAITNKKNQQRIITVVLGADSNEKRFEEARDISNWVFDNYLWPQDNGYNDLVE